MSNFAAAYSGHRVPRYTHLQQTRTRSSAPRLQPWSEVPVAVAGISLQTASGHPAHIKKSHLGILFAVAVVLHVAAAWYLSTHNAERTLQPLKAELNIELVRPPKPLEPPKSEPPKPAPPKSPPPQAQVLPQIQQSEPLASTADDSVEAPIAVAPIVTDAPAPELPSTAPVGRAGYLNNPPPAYPAQAVRNGWQGNVLLRVHVLATGKVESIEIKQTSGKKILDDEAIRTVKQWLFTPSMRGDTAIDGWATVPIEFLLDA